MEIWNLSSQIENSKDKFHIFACPCIIYMHICTWCKTYKYYALNTSWRKQLAIVPAWSHRCPNHRLFLIAALPALDSGLSKNSYLIKLEIYKGCSVLLICVLCTVNVSDTMKILSVSFDRMLSYKNHLTAQLKKAFTKITALRRICRFIPTNIMVRLYKTFILPHFDYCSLLLTVVLDILMKHSSSCLIYYL